MIGLLLIVVCIAAAYKLFFTHNEGHASPFKPAVAADSHLDVDWEKATARCSTTKHQYLVIGTGFVGQRIVKKLLERGENCVRAFDISPENPFKHDDRVEYVCGNVLDKLALRKACEGVATVYSTFAVIRFHE